MSSTFEPRRRGRRRGRLALASALAWGLALAARASALDDVTSPLTLRLNDARGIPGGQVTIQLRTYQSRPIKKGRITVGGGSGGTTPGAASSARLGGAPLPFSSCGSPVVFSVEGDVDVTGAEFDLPTQSFAFDFESPSATINASDGPLAAFVCTLSSEVVNGEEYDLTVAVGASASALDDPGLDPILIDPRSGRLRIRDQLDPGLGVEDAEVKPGASARVEIASEWAFAIESGELELELDPSWVGGAPSVSAVPRHGVVAIGVTEWNPTTGRFRFAFESSGDPEYLNQVVPGALFEVAIPTVADFDLVGNTVPWVIVSGSSSLVGPGAVALGFDGDDGSLLFSLDPKVEDVFRDGFGGGTVYPWTAQSGWSGE